MSTLTEQLAEAEKQYQQAVAQAGYCQGRVDTLRQLVADATVEPPPPTRATRRRTPSVVHDADRVNGAAVTEP